ncbi:ROK family protein [Salinarimonas chemoclinalis]|uniref:ROK family protein n=1 Tax=Salinarimonas chemoclinalis TaxID=3241599 RepID=UPI003558E27B
MPTGLPRPASGPVLALDIGGTWFRSALVGPQRCIRDRRAVPAISRRNHPGATPAELKERLVDHLVAEARARAATEPGLARVGISMGAALHQHTGVIWNSGPLWGDDATPFDLPTKLRQRAPDLVWHVVNDVSAALLALVLGAAEPPTHDVCYITVSTGIAARIWSHRAGGIVVDEISGLQGEIGHLPVMAEFLGRVLPTVCDCGGAQHLNSVSSGRGIATVLAHIANEYPVVAAALGIVPGADPVEAFTRALERDAPFARDVLSTCLRPLATCVLSMIACNPAVTKIHFGGGVTAGLGKARWKDALVTELDRYGAYQISSRKPGFFHDLIDVVDATDLGLVGAGLVALRAAPANLVPLEAI